MKLKGDCRHFPGDRPCTFHKQGLACCDDCKMYQPRGTSILVVKLEALGDVLRTTSVLPSLRRTYGNCHITWVTSEAALDLFVGNPMVDEVLAAPSSCLPAILARKFDVVINPDASRRSCELASLARAGDRYGFSLDEDGRVAAHGAAAEEWLLMGASDPLKRRNEKTYQQILHDICGVSPQGQHIVLRLTAEEARRGGELAAGMDIDLDRPVVGVNTGAGGRWRNKKWTVEGFIETIGLVLDATDAGVVLLGGEAERERNSLIGSNFPRRVVNPQASGLREFIQIVSLCDVVLTGDTLALHVAAGLEKRVVAYFGPTSSREIDLYGRGTKIVPGIDCLCCYQAECSREPNCMDLIRPETVSEAVLSHLRELAGDEPGEAAAEDYEMHTLVGEPGR